ncbi:MAG: hypothetical protein AAGJ97_00920 [Planctomycetota bacterium]
MWDRPVAITAAMCVLACAALWPSVRAGEHPEEIGVALVPRTTDFADRVEESLWRLTSDLDEVDHVHAVRDPRHMWEILDRYRRSGKRIKHLVIGGHGGDKGDGYAGVKLGSGDLMQMHVDVAALERELKTFETLLAKKEGELRENPADGRLDNAVRNLRRTVEAKREYFELAGNAKLAMATYAECVLLVCNVARDPDDEKFARTLTEMLLGRGGGTLRAPTAPVSVVNEENQASVDARAANFGIDIDAIYFDGSWTGNSKKFTVGPRWRWALDEDHPWRGMTARALYQKGHEPEFWVHGGVSSNTYFFRDPEGDLVCAAGPWINACDWGLWLELHRKIESGEYENVPDRSRWERYEYRTLESVRPVVVYP